jgi:hypothetical protein
MYFNNIPPNYGLAQYQQPQELMDKPVLGYNQGIGGLQTNQNPGQPAPQLGNIANQQDIYSAQRPQGSSPVNSTAGLGGKTITPLMPYDKIRAGQAMAEGGGVRREDGYSDAVYTALRNAADKASFGTYKYGKAGGDYAYDYLMDMLGYENAPDYSRELAEEEYALKEGEEKNPGAAMVGDIAGYAAPYLAVGPAQGALASLGYAKDYGGKAASLASLGRRAVGYAEGGVVKQNLDKSEIVSGGIAALRGQHPNPREALDAYDKTFGPDATAELMRAYADGGVVSGPGSGVADLVPGSIDGREDVRIASGEYVIPAWAVATLGDGSTEAGAKVLDAMVARLREEGSELIKGSEPINPSEFLPA